ncbi:hypothetical protein Tcan_08695 [Toxocara canis]|uniref:Uncharacterized protein n=1 Tax=Toxocara canis TaxID=6265 RepID=A0A0B2VEY9_TOXCA|nr:hypothetical protein Tcan_08695 [Toxocara canis]
MQQLLASSAESAPFGNRQRNNARSHLPNRTTNLHTSLAHTHLAPYTTTSNDEDITNEQQVCTIEADFELNEMTIEWLTPSAGAFSCMLIQRRSSSWLRKSLKKQC